ncbi:ferritin-like domain-containing protein [Ramlibacter sp.]|uniref:ferritin-like domain-containing protein n=1 Tax=Ramlibacter sp. TaxID=1917967 RepID=UPI001811D654|nr:ferritin-like domain-containing protein [Ramlibacter sp.]MBA2674450.1 ferritin-like domain-containing protein [Ramlibacter sp.]
MERDDVMFAERRLPGAAAPLHTFEAPTRVLLNEDHGIGDGGLNGLYEKAKAQQWDAARDLDWSQPHSPTNPLAMPDGTLAIHGTRLWNSMDEATRNQLRHDIQSWNLSQVLHGEQAALICAARLAQGEGALEMKLAAASQVIDEARHIEAYARVARTRFASTFAISSPLRALFGNIVSESRPDFTCLGMQILVEGMALSLFQNLRAYTGCPLFRELLTLVLRDEARHFAIGKLALAQSCAELDDHGRAEREEFICESALRLNEHTSASEIWATVGLSKAQRKELVFDSHVSQNLRRSIFRRLVPAVRDMGLLGAKARQVFAGLGMLEYAAFPAAA